VGACHHGKEHSQAVDGVDGLHIWMSDANIKNKQSRKTDKGWSSSFGDKWELTAPYHKTTNVTHYLGFGMDSCGSG
jgi:hypothetical protein